jgi:hypothetical protein
LHSIEIQSFPTSAEKVFTGIPAGRDLGKASGPHPGRGEEVSGEKRDKGMGQINMFD